jgi:hypothetical protein
MEKQPAAIFVLMNGAIVLRHRTGSIGRVKAMLVFTQGPKWPASPVALMH